MSDETGKSGLARFFSDNYGKLVRYFQFNYSDLSDMEAEDIVSDLMADLLEKADITAHVENLSAYVYRSVQNKATDYLRRRKKTISFEGAVEEENGAGRETVPEPRYDMEDAIEASEIRDRLIEALDRLEPGQRAVWIATEIEGYPFQELSKAWGVPIGTLLARKHRANAALQKELRDFNNP